MTSSFRHPLAGNSGVICPDRGRAASSSSPASSGPFQGRMDFHLSSGIAEVDATGKLVDACPDAFFRSTQYHA